MFAPATPLVPEDQDHEREFIPRDLDQERKQRRQLERVNRSVAIRRPPIIERMVKSLARFCAAVLLGIALTIAWQSHGGQGREITTALGSVLGTVLGAHTDCIARLVIAGSEHNET